MFLISILLSLLVAIVLLFSASSGYRIFPLDPPQVVSTTIKPSRVVPVCSYAAHREQQLVKVAVPAVPILEPTKEEIGTHDHNIKPTPAITGDLEVKHGGILHIGKLSTSDNVGAIVPTSVVKVRETFDVPSTQLRPPKL